MTVTVCAYMSAGQLLDCCFPVTIQVEAEYKAAGTAVRTVMLQSTSPMAREEEGAGGAEDSIECYILAWRRVPTSYRSARRV